MNKLNLTNGYKHTFRHSFEKHKDASKITKITLITLTRKRVSLTKSRSEGKL